MPGRFLAMAGALIWRESDGRYLLLRRADHRDVGAGEWEYVTGRLEQGEGFTEGLRREVSEELGIQVEIEFVLRTTHLYRGSAAPENEMVGVIFGCSTSGDGLMRLSEEHSEFIWVTADEAKRLLPEGHRLIERLERADALRRLIPPELVQLNRGGFDAVE